MANDGKINLPGGMGGLVRYDSEYKSRFMITPTHVVAFLIAIVVFVIALKVLLPVHIAPAG